MVMLRVVEWATLDRDGAVLNLGRRIIFRKSIVHTKKRSNEVAKRLARDPLVDLDFLRALRAR
jgi:hypothetical protein